MLGRGGGSSEDCIDWEAWYRANKDKIQYRILKKVAKAMEQGIMLLEIKLDAKESKEWIDFVTPMVRYNTDEEGHYLYTQAGKTRIILTEF